MSCWKSWKASKVYSVARESYAVSLVALLTAIAAATLAPMAAAQASKSTPFVAIGVWYPATVDIDAMRQDFRDIQASGFNAVLTSISWKDGEPRRGAYNLLNLDRLIAIASEVGLRVHVDVLPEPEPSWKTDGTNALAGTFYEYVQKRVSVHPAVVGVNLQGTNPPGPARLATVGSGAGLLTMRQARVALWAAIAGGSRVFGFAGPTAPISAEILALGEVAGVVTRNAALFSPLRPRPTPPGSVTVKGGLVSVDILDSANAIAIIAINRSSEVRKVTIAFPPDTPEAIWQNMEAGNAVHFVMSVTGPVLEHTFAAEDVLVLAISRKLR